MTSVILPHAAAPSGELISLSSIRRRADRLMLMLVWSLWAICLLLGLTSGQLLVALIAGALLALVATAASLLRPGKLMTRLVMALVLMGWSALLIQLGRGETEYHFSVFVLLSALLAWRDWRPLVAGAAAIALHHLVFNALQEQGLFGVVVFTHTGLHMVIMHGVFVVVQTLILLVMVLRMEKDALSAGEVAKLASVINREPGCLTLMQDRGTQHSGFARTFSLTLDTMRSTLEQASRSAARLQEDSQIILQRNSALSERTDSQVASLSVAAAAMEQLAAAASDTSQKADEARTLALQSREVAQQGGENIRAAVCSMAEIRDESQRISDILAMIDSIAFQTNILSLNASVEAARAGAHGSGFSVVAAEVRTLALRCESAAKDIRLLIAASVDRTRQGTAQVELAGKTMQTMIDNAESLHALVDALSLMSEQQRASIVQINDSITRLDRAAQENVEHVAQTMAVAEQQQQQTGALQSAIAVFRLV